MHAGLVMTIVEAPSKLYAAGVGGQMAQPAAHADTCRTYASATTIAGAGGGYVAPARVVNIGADDS